jgi:hypothetical protein
MIAVIVLIHLSELSVAPYPFEPTPNPKRADGLCLEIGYLLDR